MSPVDIIHQLPLPPDAPLGDKVKKQVLRFLSHHNRLDGIMAFMAVNWALWTILFPHFWNEWPVTVRLNEFTGGHPWVVSWTLLVAGFGSYIARAKQKKLENRTGKWYWIRTICALAAFSTWATLAYIFVSVRPIFSPGAAVYSSFAAAKLFSYINYVLRIDAEDFRVGE